MLPRGGSTQKHTTVRYRVTWASSVFKVIPTTTVNLGTNRGTYLVLCPDRLIPRKTAPGTHWAWGWVQQFVSNVATMLSRCSPLYSLSLLREWNLREARFVADTYQRCEGLPPASQHRCKPFLYPEDGGSSLHWSFGTPNYRVSHGRGQEPCRCPRIKPSFGYTKCSTGLQNSHPTRLVEHDAV
jgi:hypothetical protein